MTTEIKIPVWGGLDVAKETFDAALYLPVKAGQPPRNIMSLPKESFPRTMNGVKSFLYWTFKIRDNAGLEGGNMRIVMESTGRYSKELANWLNQEAAFTKPCIEDPKAVSDFIKSLKLRNKTDRIDAGALARYGAERMPEPKLELPKDYEYLRELTRQRAETKKQLTTSKLRLSELGTFTKIVKIQKSVVKALELAVAELELEIKNCINNSIELRECVSKAVTIPGVALITAATVLAECGPLYRFKSRQLGSFSGLAPALRQSGTSLFRSRISKRGPGRLRQVLYMASIAAVEGNGKMKALHQRLVNKGKTPLQARCAVMHKLLLLIRVIVVNRTEYNANYDS